MVREVREETGLTIRDITYFGNQPWPYPSNLMIGFIADYVSGEIKLQEEELSSGSFFSKDNLPEIPRKLSLARKMIDWWLEIEVENKSLIIMKQTTLFIFCLLAMVFGVESAASQVTRADYERADTILKCSNRVYSPAIHPEWIDSSHYFWYKNHEKEGDFLLSCQCREWKEATCCR